MTKGVHPVCCYTYACTRRLQYALVPCALLVLLFLDQVGGQSHMLWLQTPMHDQHCDTADMRIPPDGEHEELTKNLLRWRRRGSAAAVEECAANSVGEGVN